VASYIKVGKGRVTRIRNGQVVSESTDIASPTTLCPYANGSTSTEQTTTNMSSFFPIQRSNKMLFWFASQYSPYYSCVKSGDYGTPVVQGIFDINLSNGLVNSTIKTAYKTDYWGFYGSRVVLIANDPTAKAGTIYLSSDYFKQLYLILT
jgi:hypothetical protein